MNIINSFEIEKEKFFFYDITKVIKGNKKLEKLPTVLKILLEINLRNAKDTIEFDNIINIFSNRIDSKIHFFPSRVVLEEETAISNLANLAFLREVNSSVNPKVLLDLTIKTNIDEKSREKNSFFKWCSNSFSNFRLSFKNNDNFKMIDLECLSTILHIEKKDEAYYLYPETVIGQNSFGVLGFKSFENELNEVILGSKLSIDLPKVIGINIDDDLNDNSITYNIFESLKKKLNEYDFKNRIVEFYGNGLINLSLEERMILLEMASSFGAISFFFTIDKETIEYFDLTRGNSDFGHLIQRYFELQGMFYKENEELDYDEKIEIKISSLNKTYKLIESEYKSFKDINETIFKESEDWQNLEFKNSEKYNWDKNSILLQSLHIFDDINLDKIEIKSASILALLNDSISTEDISSLGQISLYSPTAKYLESKGVKSFEYGTYKDRLTNYQIMIRGLFDSKDIHNQMVSKEGGYTIDYVTNEIVPIFKEAYRLEQENKEFVLFSGENYGVGKSRDWAAKGIRVLGIKAIIAKSFGDNHRIDLIKYGVLPLEFIDDDIDTLKLKGKELITILPQEIKIDSKINAIIQKNDITVNIELKCRLDNQKELDYYKAGGVFAYLLKKSFI